MYLRIDENFATHPKTIGFVGRMQDPNAAMYLIKLWTWAVRSCPSGDLSGMLPWSIEDLVGYRGREGLCYEAMVESGFIDESASGSSPKIHNWEIRFRSSNRRTIEYGPSWPRQRELAVSRDGRVCVRCGSDDDVEVHHIVPIRLFKDDTEAGNSLSNLICLCADCHREEHRKLRMAEQLAPLRAD